MELISLNKSFRLVNKKIILSIQFEIVNTIIKCLFKNGSMLKNIGKRIYLHNLILNNSKSRNLQMIK
jgi:hypothetical protein